MDQTHISYSKSNTHLISQLHLQRHPEGGYFVETDCQTEQIPSPFADGALRSLATSIYYLLTYENPNGVFHMNKSVTYHVLHHGRAEYTLITPGVPPLVETRMIGTDEAAGEQRQLLVGSGVWKMSRLVSEDVRAAVSKGQQERLGCLITEVVVPGFQWEDHQYLTEEGLVDLFKDVDGAEDKIQSFAPFVRKVESYEDR